MYIFRHGLSLNTTIGINDSDLAKATIGWENTAKLTPSNTRGPGLVVDLLKIHSWHAGKYPPPPNKPLLYVKPCNLRGQPCLWYRSARVSLKKLYVDWVKKLSIGNQFLMQTDVTGTINCHKRFSKRLPPPDYIRVCIIHSRVLIDGRQLVGITWHT